MITVSYTEMLCMFLAAVVFTILLTLFLNWVVDRIAVWVVRRKANRKK